MVTLMRLRQLPCALVLGLLASLAAHVAAYGGAHVEGGAYHALLEDLALCGGAIGLFGAMFGAFGGAGGCLQGSVLAARLAVWLPSARLIALTGLSWFVLIESVEPAHAAVSLLAIAALMLLASIALRVAAHTVLRAIAEFVFAVVRAPFARLTLPPLPVRDDAPPVARTLCAAPRHITRPPPARSLLPA